MADEPDTAASSPVQTTTRSPGTKARIDGLDGLRALAVVGVLLYHADISWARGGFVGVDVFFVLSGYLVTSIVVARYRKTGELGFRRFWSARIRRLAPAQVALVVAVTVVVALFYAEELHDLRGQVVAALTGTTNWYLIVTNGSYFEQAGRPPLLRHLWSLGVELQFYLLFPPLLILALRVFRDRLDRVLLAVAIGVVASTVYMAIIFDPSSLDPTRVYFDTFARLAAPLMGALLALVWQPRTLARGPIRSLGPQVSMVGIVALVGLLWIMHAAGDRSALMYRGGFLVTAIVSTVIVAAIVHPEGWLGARWAFAQPLLVAIGLRSYGLYLWHWPIYTLLRPRIDVGWSWGVVFVVRLVLTFGATELCYRFIERPWHLRSPDASFAGIRRRLLQPRGIRTAPRLAALGGTFLVLVTTVVIAMPHAKNDAIEDSLLRGQKVLEHSEASQTTVPVSPASHGTTTLPESVPPGQRTVTLVGDSVMVGAAPDVLAAFDGRANIDAAVSRQATALAPIITQLGKEGHLGQVVVVQVGINGTVTDDDLHAIEKAAAGRPLYIINARVPRSWEKGNNALVAKLVPKLEKGHVIDWYSESDGRREWFLEDGVHLTESGRAGYANLIRKAVDAG